MATPLPIELSSIGMADSIILMILALVVFGPRRLPQIGRQIGKLMYEFRKASNDFKFQMEEELRLSEDADRRKKEEAERQQQQNRALTEQASVSASPVFSGPTEYNPEWKPEPPAAETPAPVPVPVEESVPELHLPRVSGPVSGPVIQPPSTGETVAAARPNPLLGSIPGALPPQADPATDSSTETVGQHG